MNRNSSTRSPCDNISFALAASELKRRYAFSVKIQMISCAALAASLPIFPAAAQVSQAAREAQTGTQSAPATSSTAADAPAASGSGRARRRKHRYHRAPPRCGTRFDHSVARCKPVYLRPEALEKQPGGTNLTLNKSLLQAPGVTQDSYGVIHVRNEHANLQYRLDGVIVPESISGLRHDLRSEDRKLDPAHHRHACRRSTATAPRAWSTSRPNRACSATAAKSGVYGGSYGWLEPSAMLQGSSGESQLFPVGQLSCATISASKTRCRRATRSTTGRPSIAPVRLCLRHPLRQRAAFPLFGGSFIGHFQIPNVTGVRAGLHGELASISFDAAKLDQNQREITHYGVARLPICRRHAELPDRAVRPLFADEVHARSQPGRRHLQRLRRRARGCRASPPGVQADGS